MKLQKTAALAAVFFFTVQARSAGNGLCGVYHAPPPPVPKAFDSGDAVLYRADPVIDFDWSTASPGFPVPPDDFQVRWTGTVEAAFSETYLFYTTSDDGVRLWVNGVLLIDNWTLHSVTTDSAAIAMTAGVPVDIRLEHYERSGFAVIKLEWSSPSQPREVIPQSRLSSPPCAPPTATATLTPSPTPSATPTWTVTPSFTDSPTDTPTPTVTPTYSVTPTHSHSPTITPTLTITQTFTVTPTYSATSEFIQETPIEIRAVFPNPADTVVKVYYTLDQPARVTFRIFDIAGQVIASGAAPGEYGNNLLVWQGSNAEGQAVASGIYLLRLEAAMPGGVDDAWAQIAIQR